jgi:hypothetical protein
LKNKDKNSNWTGSPYLPVDFPDPAEDIPSRQEIRRIQISVFFAIFLEMRQKDATM